MEDWLDSFGSGALNDPDYSRYYQKYVLSTLFETFHLDRFHRSTRILSLGCGQGLELEILRARGFTDLTGWELLPAMKELSRVPDLIEVKDVSAFHPEPIRKWEVVLILGVCHHLAQKEALHQMLRNAHRLLCPGGVLFLREPKPSPLNRLVLFLVSLRVFRRILTTGTRLPGLGRFFRIKRIQQEILAWEAPTIRAWFSFYPETVGSFLPALFQCTLSESLFNVILTARKPMGEKAPSAI